MPTRKVQLSAQTISFLEGYEDDLRKRGFPLPVIEAVAGVVIEIVFRSLPKGLLSTDPTYLGKDVRRRGFSMYSFYEKGIAGRYSCNGDFAFIVEMELGFLKVLGNSQVEELWSIVA